MTMQNNNPQYDRITELLQQQAPMPQRANLAANLFDPGAFLKQAETIQNQPIQQQLDIVKVLEAKRAAGDHQAKALDDKISLFTGNDPEGKALMLQALHDDPEEIDPTNSFQVMTKLAQVAKRTGYKSPALELERQAKEATIAKALSGLTPKPQSDQAKLKADLDAGFISQEDYDIASPAGKAKRAQDAAVSQANSVISSVDSAIKFAKSHSRTGGRVGGFYRDTPGTNAYNLNQIIEPIRASLSFDKLQEMRANSPTGGALGSVAVRELELLGNSVASLDVGQDEDQLLENLEKVKTHYQNWLNAVNASKGGQGAPQSAATDIQSLSDDDLLKMLKEAK